MSAPDRTPEDNAEQPSESLPADSGPTGSSVVDEAMRRVDGDSPRGPDTYQYPSEKDKEDRLQYEAEKVDVIDKLTEKEDRLQDLEDAAKAFGEMSAAAEAAYQNSQSAGELEIGQVRGEEVGSGTPTEQSEPNESDTESQNSSIDNFNAFFPLSRPDETSPGGDSEAPKWDTSAVDHANKSTEMTSIFDKQCALVASSGEGAREAVGADTTAVSADAVANAAFVFVAGVKLAWIAVRRNRSDGNR